MKHRIGFNALSRKGSERKALKRNMVTSLFRYERIETTKAKALEVRRMAEKMITRAKVDTVANRREIAKDIYDEDVVTKQGNRSSLCRTQGWVHKNPQDWLQTGGCC